MNFQQFSIQKITAVFLIAFFAGTLVAVCPSFAASPGPVSSMTHYWTLDELATIGGVEGFQDFGSSSVSVPALVVPSAPSPQPIKGVFNTAQEFDISTKLNVNASGAFNWAIDDEFSIEYWVRKVGIPDENQVVIGRDDDDEATELHWWTGIYSDGTAAFFLFDKNFNGGGIWGGTTNIADGNWHHIVAVRGKNLDQQLENRLFVDGQQDENAAKSFAYETDFDSQTELNIGWLSLLDPQFNFAGFLDEIALYSVALSPAEIEQHFRAGRFGDFTDDNYAGLEDVMVGIQILAGLTPVDLGMQWQNDGYTEIGLEQVIYTLQKTAGLKTKKYTEPSL